MSITGPILIKARPKRFRCGTTIFFLKLKQQRPPLYNNFTNETFCEVLISNLIKMAG